jgi:hypothetical protein
MSATPRTDAARGFHDMETAVDAEEMAKLETELAEAKALINKLLHDPNYVGGVLHWVQKHDALMLQLAEVRAKLAGEQTRSAYANNQAKTLADVVLRQTDEINGLRAEVERLTKGLAQLPEASADELKRRGLVVIAKSEVERLREDKARLVSGINDALMHLNVNYDIDGQRMRDSDAADALNAALDAARKGTP